MYCVHPDKRREKGDYYGYATEPRHLLLVDVSSPRRGDRPDAHYPPAHERRQQRTQPRPRRRRLRAQERRAAGGGTQPRLRAAEARSWLLESPGAQRFAAPNRARPEARRRSAADAKTVSKSCPCDCHERLLSRSSFVVVRARIWPRVNRATSSDMNAAAAAAFGASNT